MRGSVPRLAPQARTHALADLDRAIADAERLRGVRRRALELLDHGDVDAGVRRLRGLLHMAEQRLAQLQRSRDVLIRGEESDELREPAEASP